MSNNSLGQLSQDSVPRRDRLASVPQPRSGVRQDNPTPPRERAASPQPVTGANNARTHHLDTHPPRSQKRPSRKRKTVHLMLWVKPVVKAELERIAEQEQLSMSAVGAAFLEKALQQNLHTQHEALLDTIIEKAIRKHMRSYSTRIAILLVRSLFASEQTRSLVTNILGRQGGVTQPVLENILNGSSNAAKRNITRVTPQLATLLEEVERWIEEGENTHA